MQGRALVAVVLLSMAGPSVLAQSLGETAEQEKERKAKTKKPAKVYTNDDLSKPEDGKKDKDGKKEEGQPAATPSPSPDPERTRADVDAASKARAAEEESWRQRARALRARSGRAQQTILVIQARIDALMTDMNPNPADAFDPNRLQKIEAQKAQAIEDLEKAKGELAEARKALEGLEDEARAKGVPPSWLREP